MVHCVVIGTRSEILSVTRRSVKTVFRRVLKRRPICSLDTTASSALWVLDDNVIDKSTYLLTYLLTNSSSSSSSSVIVASRSRGTFSDYGRPME